MQDIHHYIILYLNLEIDNNVYIESPTRANMIKIYEEFIAGQHIAMP